MKLIAMFLAVLLGAGILMLTKGQINGVSPQAAAVAQGVSSADGEAQAPPRSVADVVADRRMNLRPWANAAAEAPAFDTSRFTQKRSVDVTFSIPFKDMLNEGEAAPDVAFRGVYAAARAAMEIAKLCPELLETIAIACDVTDPRAKLHGEDMDQVALTGRLLFLPRDAAGTAPGRDVVARVMFMPMTFQRGMLIRNTPEGRMGYLRMVRAGCYGLRQIVGNCVIRDVEFEKPRSSRHSPWAMTQVSARLAVYADQEQVDASKINAAFRMLGNGAMLFPQNGS
jgi:hypothetical protein